MHNLLSIQRVKKVKVMVEGREKPRTKGMKDNEKKKDEGGKTEEGE